MTIRKFPECLRDDAFQDERCLALAEDLNGVKATCQLILLLHHPHRSSDDMSFRRSISEFGKKAKGKAKDKLSKIGSSTKGRGTGVGSEGLDHSSLSLQSESAIIVGGELGEDTGVSVGNDDPRPDDSLSVSRSMVELEREPGGGDDYSARRERGQKGLHSHAYERAGRGSGQGRESAGGKEAGQVDPPRSESDIGRTLTPSILQDGESEST